MQFYEEKAVSDEEKNIFEEAEIYYNSEENEKDPLFSLWVLQIVLCIFMTAVIFLMSFFGGFREKMIEAADYFQSFELNGKFIFEEIEAMKNFITDAQS